MNDIKILAEAIMELARALTADPSLRCIDYTKVVEAKLLTILEAPKN